MRAPKLSHKPCMRVSADNTSTKITADKASTCVLESTKSTPEPHNTKPDQKCAGASGLERRPTGR